jgi:hypothetical protein
VNLFDEPTNWASELFERGYTVITHEYFQDKNNLTQLRREFQETLLSFPEFKFHPSLSQLSKSNRYVLGGFSALGNPSSFHNPFVRKLREWCMFVLVKQLFTPLLRKYHNESRDWRLEHIVDRMMARPPKEKPSKESWHRDEAPLAQAEDITFGGWINLDKEAQYFSCVPGTHKHIRKQSGFGKIEQKTAEKYNDQRHKVMIPPGGIIVFYEHIVHEVVGNSLSYPSIRLFLGWRLTKSETPMINGLETLLNNQAVMPLKSNQYPPTYAKLHWTNWRDQLQTWSKLMMQPACVESKRVESGKDKGKSYVVVHREMRSLSEYGFPLYPAYNKFERNILQPHKTFQLTPVGKSHIRQHVSLY